MSAECNMGLALQHGGYSLVYNVCMQGMIVHACMHAYAVYVHRKITMLMCHLFLENPRELVEITDKSKNLQFRGGI